MKLIKLFLGGYFGGSAAAIIVLSLYFYSPALLAILFSGSLLAFAAAKRAETPSTEGSETDYFNHAGFLSDHDNSWDDHIGSSNDDWMQGSLFNDEISSSSFDDWTDSGCSGINPATNLPMADCVMDKEETCSAWMTPRSVRITLLTHGTLLTIKPTPSIA